MKRITFLMTLAFLLVSIGCHAQVPATTHVVAINGTAPSICTGNSCTYLFSRIAVTSGALTCPVATTGTYASLNSGAETSTVAYTDKTAAGLTVCYVAQTDLGGAYSVASATAGPYVVPANPVAPTSVTGAQSTTTARVAVPDTGTQVASLRSVVR